MYCKISVLHNEHATQDHSKGKGMYTCCHTAELPEDAKVHIAPAWSPSCSQRWCWEMIAAMRRLGRGRW